MDGARCCSGIGQMSVSILPCSFTTSRRAGLGLGLASFDAPLGAGRGLRDPRYLSLPVSARWQPGLAEGGTVASKVVRERDRESGLVEGI